MVLPPVWCGTSVTPAPVAQGTGLAASTWGSPQSCPSLGCSKIAAMGLLPSTSGQEERQGLVGAQAGPPELVAAEQVPGLIPAHCTTPGPAAGAQRGAGCQRRVYGGRREQPSKAAAGLSSCLTPPPGRAQRGSCCVRGLGLGRATSSLLCAQSWSRHSPRAWRGGGDGQAQLPGLPGGSVSGK